MKGIILVILLAALAAAFPQHDTRYTSLVTLRRRAAPSIQLAQNGVRQRAKSPEAKPQTSERSFRQTQNLAALNVGSKAGSPERELDSSTRSQDKQTRREQAQLMFPIAAGVASAMSVGSVLAGPAAPIVAGAGICIGVCATAHAAYQHTKELENKGRKFKSVAAKKAD